MEVLKGLPSIMRGLMHQNVEASVPAPRHGSPSAPLPLAPPVQLYTFQAHAGASRFYQLTAVGRSRFATARATRSAAQGALRVARDGSITGAVALVAEHPEHASAVGIPTPRRWQRLYVVLSPRNIRAIVLSSAG